MTTGIALSGSEPADAAHLPPLPPGWCWTTLEAVADIEGGITKDQKRRHEGPVREVPYLRVANVQRGYPDLDEVKTIPATPEVIDALRLQPGDILFTEGGDRDKLGRGWVWGGELAECIHQNHIFRARPCRAAVEPKFVSMHGNYFGQRWFTRTGKQTTNLASINKGVLRGFPVPVPPLNEQRRIVAKVEELFSDLDAAVAALERVRVRLRRYRAAVLKAAIDGKLTEEWRSRHPDAGPASALLDRISADRRRRWEAAQRAKFAAAGKEPSKGWQAKYSEPVSANTEGLPPIPAGWCWATVEQLAEIQGGIQKQPKRAPAKNSFPFLRVANVYRGRLDLSEVHQIELFDGELERLRLEPGDLLIVEGNGSIGEIGRSAIWTDEITDCVHQNHLIRVRLLIGDPRFFDAYWNSPFGNRQVMAVAASTSGLYTLSVTKISSLPVPVPPLAEQSAIIEEVERRLSVVNQVAAQVEANLVRAGRLRQGILKRAFEGRLVPQNPADEPASVLLDRIRQQRSQPARIRATKPGRRSPVRAVLEVVGRQTAYILDQIVTPPGRTIMAKLHYFAQNLFGVPLGLLFKREKYGPFDEDIHKAERFGRKRGWFDFQDQKREKERTTYSMTPGTPAAAAEAAVLLGDRRAGFDRLLAHFGTLDSAGAELFATVYAAWNDLLLDGRPHDDEAITAEVYGWHPTKREKFSPEVVVAQIAWLKANGYAPTGTGQRTTPMAGRAGRRKGGAS
ncbi:MAG: hypothetical protein K2X87_27225 [Gemmataceae bacterium]|nr:hypothetical protein [Gemmataceae bacterium]